MSLTEYTAISRDGELDADYYIRKRIGPSEFVEFVQSVEEFWFAIIERPAAED